MVIPFYVTPFIMLFSDLKVQFVKDRKYSFRMNLHRLNALLTSDLSDTYNARRRLIEFSPERILGSQTSFFDIFLRMLCMLSMVSDLLYDCILNGMSLKSKVISFSKLIGSFVKDKIYVLISQSISSHQHGWKSTITNIIYFTW